MQDYWFFLSYARRDAIGQEYLKRFYQELAREVAAKAGLASTVKETEVGFFDEAGVEVGDRWPDTLAGALQQSRAFVCLFSRGYFNSEYCGKELAVFLARLEAYAATNSVSRPALIIPVLWDRPDRLPSIPSVISDIQYKNGKFGQVYAREGLSYIMRLQQHNNDYQEFLIRFAEQLVEVGESAPIPPLKELPHIATVGSVFNINSRVSSCTEAAESAGPRFVQFIFVAGRREEFEQTRLRERLDYYGDEGGLDWHPYLPDAPDEVAILAQEVAAAEKLRYEVVPLGSNIVDKIEEAERKNKVVALIVDTWTLRLEQYSTFMREYDKRSFLNCVVLVAWNNDDETITSRSMLESAVGYAFPNRAISRDPNSFLDWISSPDELRRELTTTLSKARMRVVEKARVVKRAESSQVIRKPIISGPGLVSF